MAPRVTATREALDLIGRLRAVHGPLAFFISGGCCEGSAPICLPEHELEPGAGDVCLGEIGAAPVYIAADQDVRWKEPDFVVDVADEPSDTFSLEGPYGVRFVTVARLDAGGPARHNGRA